MFVNAIYMCTRQGNMGKVGYKYIGSTVDTLLQCACDRTPTTVIKYIHCFCIYLCMTLYIHRALHAIFGVHAVNHVFVTNHNNMS